MTRVQARIVFIAFICLASGIVVNAVYLQNSDGQRQAVLYRDLTTATVKEQDRGQDVSSVTAVQRLEQLRFESPDVSKDLVRAIQFGLRDKDYNPGPADGMAGIVTRAAIMAFEFDHGLALTAEPSESLLRLLLFGEGKVGDKATSTPRLSEKAQGAATLIVQTVQAILADFGYDPGPVDGMIGQSTIKAIKSYESNRGLPLTGRISGKLIQTMQKLNNATPPSRVSILGRPYTLPRP